MIRWLAIICLLAAPAGAQVFKPKSGSTPATTSTSTKSKAKKASTGASKKSAHKTASKKKKKAAPVADEAPKVDPDYVKIIDDDDE